MKMITRQSTMRLAMAIVLAVAAWLWFTYANPYSTDLRDRAQRLALAKQRVRALVAKSRTAPDLDNVALAVSDDGELLVAFAASATASDANGLHAFLSEVTRRDPNPYSLRYMTPVPENDGRTFEPEN